ncbi:MAG TPA: DNRLRE domain-containing protein [Anaerolineales bacterium]|nr:DNRLRE domain-containing protein [Anaerolineales bacterium]
MQALLDDANGLYVTDDTPNAEPRYRARFYLDPNSLTMANNDAFFLFRGFQGTSTDILRVELRYSSSAYQIRAALMDDASTWVNTNWFNLTDAAHYMEVDWKAATSAGANNGYLTLWIDGTQSADLTSVDNDTWSIDRARLGALTGIDAGTSGTFYLDAFESRRSSYIGPMAFGGGHFTSYHYVPLQQGNSYTGQPDATDGIDTYLLNTSPTTNNGTAVTMWIGESNNATDKVARSLIKFDLSSIPSNATITSATLSLWTDADFSDNDRTIRVYRLKVPFSETQATWNEASTGVNWQSPGASGTNDRESTDIGWVLIPENQALDVEKQIPLSTAQIQEMINGTFTNNGFIIIADTELNDRFSYKTSDASAGTKRPKLVIEYTTSSSTPTNTPTPGPSPTATRTQTPGASPTPTPTQPPQVAFNSATFTYDGDGKRVKSTFNGATTTYFVGNHYEVTGSTVIKYYYAGAQRIAMRTNGTLNFLLGDHLGSTSLITDSTGVKTNEQRYKAWGETRYTFGSEKTKFQYTGQYSYVSDFGLHYYNARWYDSSLGRFAQADSIIPIYTQGVQAWDRYAYTNNNPVLYVDPTGHSLCQILGTFLGFSLSCPSEGANDVGALINVGEKDEGGADINVPVPPDATPGIIDVPEGQMGSGALINVPGQQDDEPEGYDPAPNDGLGVIAATEDDESPEDILMPDGNPIGTSEDDERIRTIQTEEEMEEIFDRLTVNGTSVTKPTYEGDGYNLPDGGFVGWRDSRDHGPTIDINIPGIPIDKLHLPI